MIYRKLITNLCINFFAAKELTDNKSYTQRMSRLRSSTVEPVLGILINFMSMRRVTD